MVEKLILKSRLARLHPVYILNCCLVSFMYDDVDRARYSLNTIIWSPWIQDHIRHKQPGLGDEDPMMQPVITTPYLYLRLGVLNLNLPSKALPTLLLRWALPSQKFPSQCWLLVQEYYIVYINNTPISLREPSPHSFQSAKPIGIYNIMELFR